MNLNLLLYHMNTPEEGWRMHLPKRREYINENEDNGPSNLNDKNYQATSKKIRQISSIWSLVWYHTLFTLLSESLTTVLVSPCILDTMYRVTYADCLVREVNQ